MKKVIAIIILLFAVVWFWPKDRKEVVTPVTQEPEASRETTVVLAENLAIPWDVGFLPASPALSADRPAGGPSGEILLTERPGSLLLIKNDRATIKVEGVRHIGEGGLLGLALHPEFKSNRFLYLYFTSGVSGKITNRVERYRLEGANLSDRLVIVEGIPGSSIHDGGQIEFGRDNLLYITTGDAGNQNSAQDTKSLSGKILRIRDDGSNFEIYSYGHRNPQGLAWDEQGRLWATEHGRSGLDELNLIEKGKNYGWPVIQGDERKAGMETPKLNSGSDVTWAPSGLAYLEEKLYFGGLRGESLYEAKLDGDKVTELKQHFAGQYGRIRAVVVGPDKMLYITTSNTDGRGQIKSGDDKLIRIDPKILE